MLIRTIPKYSLKKIDQLNGEVAEREALCRRAGGTPVQSIEKYKRDGTTYDIVHVTCYGGKCECGCGMPAHFLEPHENHLRSQGGNVSRANSLMVRRDCHHREQTERLGEMGKIRSGYEPANK